jgi:hypothetical protein
MNEVRVRPDCDSTRDNDPLEEDEILEEIVLALVSQTSSVFIKRDHTDDVTHLTIHTAPEDVGKIIGRNGETISLLRRLFGRISAATGRKTFIHVAEPAKISRPVRYRTAC